MRTAKVVAVAVLLFGACVAFILLAPVAWLNPTP